MPKSRYTEAQIISTLEQLPDENRRLGSIVADFTLDKQVLEFIVRELP